MSAATNIEWCHATVNWWTGCTAISPACDNCYAKRMAGRLWGTEWGTGKPRDQFMGADATLRALDRKAKRLGYPLRVFHNSLSDFFDNEVPAQWRISAMHAMVETPNLIHILLTKRIGNAAAMLEEAFRAVHGQREGWADNVPPNFWIGATIADQEGADRDIPKLLAVPAAKRVLSMEPLLGLVQLRSDWLIPEYTSCQMGGRSRKAMQEMVKAAARKSGEALIDWVIVGGESGPGARPMHPDWARTLRDQCEDAGVPFLFKQWGEWTPGENVVSQCGTVKTAYLEDDGWNLFRENLATEGGHIDDQPDLYRVGKKAAGRMLDGRTWDGYPS